MGVRVPAINLLKSNYPTNSKMDLAAEMGLSEQATVLWDNLCAIRVSYCLLKCGIRLGKEPDRGAETLIRKGPVKDSYLWMSQKNLSTRLLEVFGVPQYQAMDKQALKKAIGKSGGVISFVSLTGYEGGHIDIVYYDENWFTSTFAGDYDLMSEDIAFFNSGFDSYFGRAKGIRFWRSR